MCLAISPSSNDMSSAAAAASSSQSQGSDTPPTLAQQQNGMTSYVHDPITFTNTLYQSFEPSIIHLPDIGSVGAGVDSNSNSASAGLADTATSMSSRCPTTTNSDSAGDAAKFDKWLGDIISTSSKADPVTIQKQKKQSKHRRPGMTAQNKQRIFVQHNYHDLSLEPDDAMIIHTDIEGGSATKNESFALKLHRILDETEKNGMGHIISWQPHGRAFKIHNAELFTERIMPLYFPRMNKITSLQRQFNLYGFERLTCGPDAGSYYHEAFLRHRPMLTQRMSRKRVKGTGYKAAANPDAEPDFYTMPFMDHLMTMVPSSPSSSAAAAASSFTYQAQEKVTPGYQRYDSEAGVVTESSNTTRSSYYSNGSVDEYHQEPTMKVASAGTNNMVEYQQDYPSVDDAASAYQLFAILQSRNESVQACMAPTYQQQQHLAYYGQQYHQQTQSTESNMLQELEYVWEGAQFYPTD